MGCIGKILAFFFWFAIVNFISKFSAEIRYRKQIFIHNWGISRERTPLGGFEAQLSWLDGSSGATDVLEQTGDMRELPDCHWGFPAPIPSLVLAKSALHLKLIEMGLTVNLSTETPVI